MGLFSSKKKTKVYTATVRVVSDAQIPDTPKSSTLKAILRRENIAEHMVDGVINSLPIKAKRMLRYAESKYAYGLPKSTVVTDLDGQDIVQQVISEQVGYPITMGYFKYSSLNSLHVGWSKLVGQYGYNSNTNELEVLSQREGVPVYLKDMVAVYTQETIDEAEEGDLDQWGDSPSSGYTPERPLGAFNSIWKYAAGSKYVLNPKAVKDTIEVYYVFEVEIEEEVEGITLISKELREGMLEFDLELFDETKSYYHVEYRNQQGMRQYWTYQEGKGTYPEIDAIYKTNYDSLGTYFPFTYFRLNKRNLTDESRRDTDEYKTSKKLMDKLGLDYDSLAESVHANPGIRDIEQALMIWAVPANTENEDERRYLFDYFNLLYYNSSPVTTLASSLAESMSDFTNRGSQAIVIKDRAYEMVLKFQGISKRRVAGKVGDGKVGRHHSEYGVDIRKEVILIGNQNNRDPEARTIETPHYSYRRQVSSTFYEEIRVYNPTLTYEVWGGKNVVASKKSESLLIPLDQSITDLIPLLKREVLFSRSLHFVMNTRITTKEKWYQSGFFKVVMIIIAVVITFFYPPGGAALWGGIAAAGVIIYSIAVIVVSLIIDFVVGAVLSFVAKTLGAEIALALAIALIAYGGYQGIQEGLSIAQTYATNVVKLGTNLVKASVSEYFRSEADVLDKETGEFKLMVETKDKEIEDAKKLLGGGLDLSPYEFIGYQPMIVWGETPKDLYSRTVESGNIGMATIEMVKQYVPISLTLPKTNSTLGFKIPEDTA